MFSTRTLTKKLFDTLKSYESFTANNENNIIFLNKKKIKNVLKKFMKLTNEVEL